MNKVFVTGADGFIGSHLCEALRDRGDEVTGLALYNSFDSFGWLDQVEGVEKVSGDIRDPLRITALIRGHDTVFHLAALGSVPYSNVAPQSFIDTNITGTSNVLIAALNTGAKVVHTSSSEVYGSGLYEGPMNETHPKMPQSRYAASKVAADALVHAHHMADGLPAVILRPFNTYGPRQSERALMATIVRQMLDPDCQDVELGNFDIKRDLTYVTDTVKAFLAVAKLDEFGVYNSGSGEAYGLVYIAARAQKLVGCHKPLVSKPERLRPRMSDVLFLQANADHLFESTGWKPEVGLDAGLKATVDWWRTRDLTTPQRYVA